MVTLPVSRHRVQVRLPDGKEEMLLLEAGSPGVELALALAIRLVRAADGAPLAWDTLPLTDLDAALLAVRQQALGDWIRTDASCPDGCGERIDVAFRISDYLTFHQPRRPRGVEELDGGWYCLKETDVAFCLPTAMDLLAAQSHSRPGRALLQRCVRPPAPSGMLRRRVERAMSALAPSLASEIAASCPECGTALTFYFDPQAYVLQELREAAADLYGEIHLLAFHYHWSEDAILALPRPRRMQLAEMIRRERGAA